MAPDIAYLDELRLLSGNAQFKAAFDKRERLRQDYTTCRQATQQAEEMK